MRGRGTPQPVRPQPEDAPAGPRPRDSQRARVYRAERDVPEGRHLPALADVQRYVDRVTASPLWCRLAPGRPRVEVRDGRGRRRAGSYIGRAAITIPRVHRRERHVLHELAHQLAEAGGGPDEPAHGWRFAAGLLLLLERFVAPDVAETLRCAYAGEGVRYRPPAGVPWPGPGAAAPEGEAPGAVVQ